MSLFLQIALGVLVAGGLGLGAWKHHENVVHNEAAMHEKASTEVNLSAGTTNTDLDKDMLTIDSQLKVIDQDAGDIDQSTNDKPIQ